MTWDYFVPFSIAALHFWGFGAFAAWRGRKPYVIGGLTRSEEHTSELQSR